MWHGFARTTSPSRHTAHSKSAHGNRPCKCPLARALRKPQYTCDQSLGDDAARGDTTSASVLTDRMNAAETRHVVAGKLPSSSLVPG